MAVKMDVVVEMVVYYSRVTLGRVVGPQKYTGEKPVQLLQHLHPQH